MRNKRFAARLRTELPQWIERGWVTPGADHEILSSIDADTGGDSKLLPYALSILGVLLLGAGIITFFAANWDSMAKFVKLSVLFGSMWTAYAGAWYFLTGERSRAIGEALLLLAVILFGANIMLIAQIYHIDKHYPDGVMWWALGALLAAYALRSQPALFAAIALAALWSGMETFDFGLHIHWSYFMLFALFLPIIYIQRWKPALHLAIVGLLFWTAISFIPAQEQWLKASPLFLWQIYFLVFIGLFLCGQLMNTTAALTRFAPIVEGYALFAALSFFYALTFPDLHKVALYYVEKPEYAETLPYWIAATLIAAICVAGLAVWLYSRMRAQPQSRVALWGTPLVSICGVMALVHVIFPSFDPNIVAVGFNLLFFATTIWLMYYGQAQGRSVYINFAFVFFGLGLISRYFDAFWTLFDRSLYFMAGGALLIGGAYFLERQRRALIRNMPASPGKEEGM